MGIGLFLVKKLCNSLGYDVECRKSKLIANYNLPVSYYGTYAGEIDSIPFDKVDDETMRKVVNVSSPNIDWKIGKGESLLLLKERVYQNEFVITLKKDNSTKILLKHRKMKKILIIEDNGSLYTEIKNRLESKGYAVYYAYSYVSALDRLEEEKEDFSCIILDLQINPTGLSIEENEKYTALFGMAVLQYLLKDKTEEVKISWRKKIIIYSGYTMDLKNRSLYTPEWNLKNLTIIPKKQTA